MKNLEQNAAGRDRLCSDSQSTFTVYRENNQQLSHFTHGANDKSTSDTQDVAS